jgi:hypothetical protein
MQAYEALYREYQTLYTYFGTENSVMHRLRAMKKCEAEDKQ